MTATKADAAARRVERWLALLDETWNAFHTAYAGLSDDDLLEPGVCGAWSIRDLIAHIAWWEEEAIKHLPVILDGGQPPRYSVAYGGIDAFNALMTERLRALSLAEVRQLNEETHRRLVAFLRGIPPERLTADPRVRRRLKLDTFGHYPIHTAQIIAWRAAREQA